MLHFSLDCVHLLRGRDSSDRFRFGRPELGVLVKYFKLDVVSLFLPIPKDICCEFFHLPLAILPLSLQTHGQLSLCEMDRDRPDRDDRVKLGFENTMFVKLIDYEVLVATRAAKVTMGPDGIPVIKIV